MLLAGFSKLVNVSIIAEFFQLCQYRQHMLKFEQIYERWQLIFTAASLIIFSYAILNSRQSSASPCRTPFLTLMRSDNLFYILTRHWVLFIVALTKAISFRGIFISSMAACRLRLCMLSYRLKINKEEMRVLSIFTTFFKNLTYSQDVVYCGPFPAITTLVIANGFLCMGHEPIKQDAGDLLSNTY